MNNNSTPEYDLPEAEAAGTGTEAVTTHRPPATLEEWDAKYPGILDSLGLLGGTANVIMQLSLAGVGRGVLESRVESGRIFDHPIKRARTTVTFLSVAMFGTDEEKKAYRTAINGAHRQVHSTEESPVEYHAMNPQLQLWVALCLAWGMADSWQRLRGKADQATLDELYQDLAGLGTTLQVKPEMWPKSMEEFEKAWQHGLDNAAMDDEVKALANRLSRVEFLGKVPSKLMGRASRYRTAGFLPHQLRTLLGWEWSDADQQKFDRRIAMLGKLTRTLPLSVRAFAARYTMNDLRRRLATGKPLI